jgi:hypothetical protein
LAGEKGKVVMAQYKFLQDVYVDRLYPAGTIASTADVGGTLPSSFLPPAAVDPLDSAAVTAFYAQGPQQVIGPIRAQFSTQGVSGPVTYWTGLPGSTFSLTGLGVAFAPISK